MTSDAFRRAQFWGFSVVECGTVVGGGLPNQVKVP
jgi:hypothetical protein